MKKECIVLLLSILFVNNIWSQLGISKKEALATANAFYKEASV